MPSVPKSVEAGHRLQTRKRRAILVVATLLTVAIVVVGVQSWRIVNAIVEAESAVVVPLPPSEPNVAGGSTSATNVYEVADTGAFVPDQSVFGSEVTESDGNSTASRENPDSSAAPQPDTPSRLEVAQALAEAGIANGDPGQSSVWQGASHLDILVLGVDRREDGGDQNADVIIIVRLDLLEKTISGVSIPRDLLVDIPGVGPDKINGSYNHGVLQNPDDPISGVVSVRDTIEANFDVSIDHYLLIDFAGFESVVDALGGVSVDVPYRIVDDSYPTADYGTETVTFEPGRQTLDGESALKYVRTRHADGDDARRQRQIDVIVAALGSGKSLSSIANADELILAVGDAVQTSFTLEQQLTLARIAMALSPDDVDLATITEPDVQSGWTDDGRWVYVGDIDHITAIVQRSLERNESPSDSEEGA